MSTDTVFASAIARHEAKHERADSLLFNSASLVWDAVRKVYIVTVRGHVVAEPRTLRDVRTFSDMHNGRLAEAMSL